MPETANPASRFARRLQPRRIGISGHSFGGHTTLRVAAVEPRIRAALALAPAITALGSIEIGIPTMVQGAERDSLTPFAVDSVGAFALLTGPRFLVEILNTGHFAFSDICAGEIFGTPDCAPGTLSQDEAHELVLRFAVPFLLRYVAGNGSFGRLLRPQLAPAGVVYQAEPRR